MSELLKALEYFKRFIQEITPRTVEPSFFNNIELLTSLTTKKALKPLFNNQTLHPIYSRHFPSNFPDIKILPLYF